MASGKRLTTEEFTERAKAVHDDRYDYSKVNYINNKTKLTIICSKHGEFEQRPYDHLNGSNCPSCAGRKTLTTEEFIERAKAVHDDRYDYSKVNYVSRNTKVTIICPKHGEFEQRPYDHSNGYNCPSCAGCKRLTTESFIQRGKEVHGDKYDYSLVEFYNQKIKVRIICPEHGKFEQSPSSHIYGGHGCDRCSIESRSIIHNSTTEEFITKARKIHGDRYNYSLVVYDKALIKVKIICSKHGEFEQRPNCHLSGHGCPVCSGRKNLTTEEFITKARKIHADKYDYSKVNYINNTTLVRIICPEHGEFEQKPVNHLTNRGCPTCGGAVPITTEEFIRKSKLIHGDKYDYTLSECSGWIDKIKIICPEHGEFIQRASSHYKGHGCQICSSPKGEKMIWEILSSNEINFVTQHQFDDCLSPKGNPLKFDFYLPEHKICIEHDGKQHSKQIKYFGGRETLERYQLHDSIKNKYSKDNNIPLIRINYKEDTESKLISELSKHGINLL